HLPSRRLATLRIDVPCPPCPDDSFYPLLGYHIGKIATNEIPIVCGLEGLPITRDDLKAFAAAFATTSAVAMFHILGITPEAKTIADAVGAAGEPRRVTVAMADLKATWHELNTATSADVGLVSLGNPHFSLTECERLADLCTEKKMSEGVAMIVTCGRDVY